MTEHPRRHLEPRDVAAAAQTGQALLLAAALVTAAFAAAQYGTHASLGTVLGFAVPSLLLIAAAALRWGTIPARSVVWTLIPLLGIVCIVALDLATEDSSAAAQVFLCFPVLYSSSQLRALAASLVAVCAVVANAVIAYSLEPFAQASLDFVYVSATLITMTALLVRAGVRQDRLVAQLRELATIDPLTGLVTRRVFDDVARSALAQRKQGAGTALIVIDVDSFKEINDSYGHPVGDDALVHLAKVLAASTRPDSVISRIGGDELAILVPDCSYEAARRRATELVKAVRSAPLQLPDGAFLEVSVSVGVAQAPLHAAELRELYAVADAALYRAKRDGRNQVGASGPVR